MANESIKKAFMESTRQGGFGVSSSRSMSLVRRHESSIPGPSHYQVVKTLSQLFCNFV